MEVLGELGVIYREFPIDEAGEWEKNIDVFAKERGYKNVSGRRVFSSMISCGAGPSEGTAVSGKYRYRS